MDRPRALPSSAQQIDVYADADADQTRVDPADMFDLLPDAYLILGPRLEVVSANAPYCELMGLAVADIRGMSVYDINQFGSPQQRANRRAWLDDVLNALERGETRASAVLRYDIASTANPRSVRQAERQWQIHATRAARGMVVIRVSDISENMALAERQRREHAMLRSQARLRQVLVDEATAQLNQHRERLDQVLAFAKVGAWQLDLASGAIDCTAQCKENVGVAEDDLLTHDRLFDDLIDQRDRSRVRAEIERAIHANTHFELEYRVTGRDGTEHWLLLHGMGSYMPDGTPHALVGFTLDITARKEAELRHQAMAAEEKLARQESDRVAQAMDHFVTAVSHELRSPLHAITQWTTLLRSAPDSGHADRAAIVIERNARQLAHMVDDLLDSGAIISGKLSTHPTPVDLAALAANVLEDIRMTAEAKGLHLTTDALISCTVLVDESRLKQVTWNLLTNAVKFTSHGTVTLSVTVENGHAVMTVRDTGAGLAPDQLARIFERFHQVGESNHASGTPGSAPGSGRLGGLGLGLWLVSSLVTMHGGTVRADSPGTGLGATFTVTLPLYR